jgi:hypothetical protein
MADVERLLHEFIAADRAGPDPEPADYLRRARGTDRAELGALIDRYLARAPRRAFDEAAFAASRARTVRDELVHALAGGSGLWPTLLPRLRHRAQLKRAELVRRLSADLGAAGSEEKVGAYYHAMEQGLLPAAGVSDRVLEALGRIVGETTAALRQAGDGLTGAPGGAGTPAPTFARVATPDARYDEQEPAGGPPPAEAPGERDFVDELFTGGSDQGS